MQAYHDALGLDCTAMPVMVGTEETRAARPLRLYPNPTTSTVTIAADAPLGRVALMDVQGRSLLELSTAAHRYDMDLRAHPAGIYLVKVYGAYGVRVARLVKQ